MKETIPNWFIWSFIGTWTSLNKQNLSLTGRENFYFHWLQSIWILLVSTFTLVIEITLSGVLISRILIWHLLGLAYCYGSSKDWLQSKDGTHKIGLLSFVKVWFSCLTLTVHPSPFMLAVFETQKSADICHVRDAQHLCRDQDSNLGCLGHNEKY